MKLHALALALGACWIGDAGALDTATLMHKERFVGNLLIDSPMVRRIERGDDPRAKALLSEAQARFRHAQAMLREGRIAEGEAALNEALRGIGRARQLAPDSVETQVTEGVRYARLRSSVESMLASYERSLAEAGRHGRDLLSEDVHVERARALLDDARSLAEAESIVQANKALESAEQGLMTRLSRMLANRTLRYVERFDTAEDEFAHETRRHSSFAELVPAAIREFRPAPDRLQLVQRRVERGQSLRDQAHREAARRDWEAALRSIRAGTVELERALAHAGLVVPGDGRSGSSE